MTRSSLAPVPFFLGALAAALCGALAWAGDSWGAAAAGGASVGLVIGGCFA